MLTTTTCHVQALTAELNMQTTQMKEHQSENSRLRNEIYDWKRKYYDCRRKVAVKTQYAPNILQFVLDIQGEPTKMHHCTVDIMQIQTQIVQKLCTCLEKKLNFYI